MYPRSPIDTCSPGTFMPSFSIHSWSAAASRFQTRRAAKNLWTSSGSGLSPLAVKTRLRLSSVNSSGPVCFFFLLNLVVRELTKLVPGACLGFAIAFVAIGVTGVSTWIPLYTSSINLLVFTWRIKNGDFSKFGVKFSDRRPLKHKPSFTFARRACRDYLHSFLSVGTNKTVVDSRTVNCYICIIT